MFSTSKVSDQVRRLLDLRPIGGDVFEGPPSREDHVRTFGGQLVAQAFMAAGLTAGDRMPQSFHSYFLLPGKTNRPIDYLVERVRDGRSFAARHVHAKQDDNVLLRMLASFHTNEAGIEHQPPMPDVDPPELLDRFDGRNEHSDMGKWLARLHMFDIRFLGPTPFDVPCLDRQAHQRMWLKTIDPLPDDPLLHGAIVSYASDIAILNPILLKHGEAWTDQKVLGASLDHAMWFHRPFRVDEWLLFDYTSPISHGARGFSRAEVWTEDGQMACSIAQEALLRPPRQFSV